MGVYKVINDMKHSTIVLFSRNDRSNNLLLYGYIRLINLWAVNDRIAVYWTSISTAFIIIMLGKPDSALQFSLQNGNYIQRQAFVVFNRTFYLNV